MRLGGQRPSCLDYRTPAPPRPDRRSRWALDGAGVAGLAVFAVLVWRTSEYSPFLYRGGLVLLSFATALMVAAAASPASRFGRILGGESLRWLGVRSYGIYLWHFPIIVLTTPAAGGDTPSRRVLQLAAIIGCAARAYLIARALVAAFPDQGGAGQPSSCLVR
jgi:peptidoglycan/LPS O-acetylase OafA/YrhL